MSLISQRFVVYFPERLGDECTNSDVAIGGGDGGGDGVGDGGRWGSGISYQYTGE